MGYEVRPKKAQKGIKEVRFPPKIEAAIGKLGWVIR